MPINTKNNGTTSVSFSKNISDGWWSLRKGRFAPVAIVASFMVLWYLIILWGYRSDRLPYQFDNFVQETGIWKVLGAKTYHLNPSDDYPIDPRINTIVKVSHSVSGSGYLTRNDPDVPSLTLDHPEDGPTLWEVDAELYIYVTKDGETNLCPLCTQSGLVEGEILDIRKNGRVDVETGEIETESFNVTREVF